MSAEEKVIQNKLGLLKLAEELGNVAQACKYYGYSRDSFYRYKKAVAEGGPEALREINRRKPNPKNRVALELENRVVAIATENPALGQQRVSNELKKEGLFISPGGVRSIWLRHDLETVKKRLKALEAKAAQDSFILTDEQLAALEKAKTEKDAHGEIETAHPGYLGVADVYYVGTIKGVGRIYQQTFLDSYTRMAFCKLYPQKDAITSAEILNDRVLPFYERENIRLLRILTDRGTEYCGKVEHHPFQLYLATEDIEHTRTKVRSPQTNGFAERFHRTIQEEFYSITFRKKIYGSIESLQADLDEWLTYYNTQRPHSGRYCYGKTPWQTWQDSKHLAHVKMLPPAKVNPQTPN